MSESKREKDERQHEKEKDCYDDRKRERDRQSMRELT